MSVESDLERSHSRSRARSPSVARRLGGAGQPPHIALAPADAQFLQALHDADLAPAEAARITYLLAVGGGHVSPLEKPLPETLVASLPDFGAEQMGLVRRLWACDVPLAEISRVVEVMRERERERRGGGSDGGATEVVDGGLAASPPVYAP